MKLSNLIFPVVFAIIVAIIWTFKDNIINSGVKESVTYTERGYVESVGLHTETSGTFLSVHSETVPVAMIKLPSTTTELKDKELLSKFKAGDSIYVRFKYQEISFLPMNKQVLIEDVDLLKANLKSESKIKEQHKAENDKIDQMWPVIATVSILIVAMAFISFIVRLQHQ